MESRLLKDPGAAKSDHQGVAVPVGNDVARLDSNPSQAVASAGSPQSQHVETLPRRFRSAFILYSAVRHKQVRDQLGQCGKCEKTANVAKLISKDWRAMPPAEKEVWLQKAREDKARYQSEMEQYKASATANGKNNSASTLPPKRPMSAYLAFSNERRGATRRLHPDANNKELSRILATSWKEADPEVRKKYIDTEARLRAQYNLEMVPFRNKKSKSSRAVHASKQDEAKEPCSPKVTQQPMSQDSSSPLTQEREGNLNLSSVALTGFNRQNHHAAQEASSQNTNLSNLLERVAASGNGTSFLDALRTSVTEQLLLRQIQQQDRQRQQQLQQQQAIQNLLEVASRRQQQQALVDELNIAQRLLGNPPSTQLNELVSLLNNRDHSHSLTSVGPSADISTTQLLRGASNVNRSAGSDLASLARLQMLQSVSQGSPRQLTREEIIAAILAGQGNGLSNLSNGSWRSG